MEKVSSPDSLDPGTLLFRRKGVVMHVGVYLGDGEVFHNIPEKGECVSSYQEFSRGKQVHARKQNISVVKLKKEAQKRLQAPQDYHLLHSNCEHSATSLLFESAVSKQLNEVITYGYIGAALGKGFGKRGTWLGGALGAAYGLVSLPRLIKR